MARNSSQGQVVYEFEPYRLDPVQRVLRRGDEFVPLAPKAFDILLILVESAGRPVDKKDLLERAWPDTFVEEGSLTQSISILRKVLEQGGSGVQYIQTISKRGYRFSAPVKLLEGVPGDEDLPISNGRRTDSASEESGPRTKANWERWLWLTGFAALVAFALAEPYLLKTPKVEIGPTRFVLSPPEGTRIHPASAVSPDGSKVAFVAIDRSGSRALWVRPVGAETMQRLDDTEGALLPFWSPDSAQIGFFANGKLKVLPAAGGSARIVCEQRYPGGGTWNRDGVIVFSQSGRLYRVSAAGGAPVLVMELDSGRGEIAHTWPQFLPDGHRFLFFTEVSGGTGRAAASGAYLASLESPDRRLLMAGRYRAAFAPPDYLLFVQNGSLVAQRVDLKRGLVTGEPARVADGVTVRLDRFFVNPQPGLAIDGGGAAFSVSDNGVLLYHSGSPPKTQIVWYGRDGTRLGRVGEPQEYAQIRLAPDDRHAAVAIKNTEKDDWENWSLWLVDTETNLPSRLTFGAGRDADPVWSPDSSKVVYSTFSKSVRRVDMMEMTVGQNSPVVFYRDEHSNKPDAWSPDGRYILYRRDERVVLTLTTGADRKPAVLSTRRT
jgi:DNA-binding winged helix-turn-helix (wHTH) protein/dipeptidyl aminopeptidase/acylaminoacyl peptidase